MQLRTVVKAVLVLLVTHSASAAQQRGPFSCRVAVIEGEVRSGESFRTPVLAGVDMRFEPISSGWELRVVPRAFAGQDWAEMATPPYRSVSPLRVNTEFNFRAQDAVGWNPRRFRFAADEASFAQLRSLRQSVETGAATKAATLAELASRQPEGVLDILDAHLVPGTANQSRSAAFVASHFATTAHELEQPIDGRSTPLGMVRWLRFRVTLQLPRGARVAPGIKVSRGSVCGDG